MSMGTNGDAQIEFDERRTRATMHWIGNDSDDATDKPTLPPAPPDPPPSWRDFEAEVASYIRQRIDGMALGLDPSAACVVPRLKMHSLLRKSEIIFDVGIQVFSKESRDTPVFVWLWECKNYGHAVPVDDVEEFDSKVQQVGAHKGTIVTRTGFQSGAVEFAKSRGIGLIVLDKERQSLIAMSQDAGYFEFDEIVSNYCLYTFGLELPGPSGPTLETMIGFEISKLAIK